MRSLPSWNESSIDDDRRSSKMADSKINYTPTGIRFGTVAALLCSYMTHGFSGWTIAHGIFGWFYVLYWTFGGGQ
jgi:hypothetical protein